MSIAVRASCHCARDWKYGTHYEPFGVAPTSIVPVPAALSKSPSLTSRSLSSSTDISVQANAGKLFVFPSVRFENPSTDVDCVDAPGAGRKGALFRILTGVANTSVLPPALTPSPLFRSVVFFGLAILRFDTLLVPIRIQTSILFQRRGNRFEVLGTKRACHCR
jgi:hypothetical protein